VLALPTRAQVLEHSFLSPVLDKISKSPGFFSKGIHFERGFLKNQCLTPENIFFI
jgi:hypothetical protein